MACPFLSDIMLLPSPTVERKVIGLKARPCLVIMGRRSLNQAVFNLSTRTDDSDAQYCT
jgi:hypothetical protein